MPLDFFGDLWYNKGMRRWEQRRLFFCPAIGGHFYFHENQKDYL